LIKNYGKDRKIMQKVWWLFQSFEKSGLQQENFILMILLILWMDYNYTNLTNGKYMNINNNE
jgi:hypothetical protein